MRQRNSEADIERTCSDFLALDGWRSLKTDPCSDRARGKGFGEVGMADRLYLRYEPKPVETPNRQELGSIWPGCEVAWIEWKSKRGKPTPEQIAWHQVERARGALTWIAGVDFPASIEGFMQFYRESGLLRRAGL